MKRNVSHQAISWKDSIACCRDIQAAGVISRELEAHFFGRVGLFRNQPGDMLLKRSDLVIAIGYDPIEYEARNWNAEKDARIIVIDEAPAEIDPFMQPERELIGDISATLDLLTGSLEPQQVSEDAKEYLASLQAELTERDIVQSKGEAGILHPLEVINTLQSKVTDDMTVTVDVGSHYIWMARHFEVMNLVICYSVMVCKRLVLHCHGRFLLHWCVQIHKSYQFPAMGIFILCPGFRNGGT